MDYRSHLKTLSCFTRKPPALRGLPYASKEFLAESGDGTRHGLFQAWKGFFSH